MGIEPFRCFCGGANHWIGLASRYRTGDRVGFDETLDQKQRASAIDVPAAEISVH